MKVLLLVTISLLSVSSAYARTIRCGNKPGVSNPIVMTAVWPPFGNIHDVEFNYTDTETKLPVIGKTDCTTTKNGLRGTVCKPSEQGTKLESIYFSEIGNPVAFLNGDIVGFYCVDSRGKLLDFSRQPMDSGSLPSL